MSVPKRASTTFWQWPIIVSMILPALLNMHNFASSRAFLSLDLSIAGAGILLSGILLRFVALPRAEADPGKDRGRAMEYERAIVGPFIALGALIVGLGGALFVLSDDPSTTNIIWAVFALLMLVVLSIIMVRAWRTFVVRPKNE
jgi:small-conductance mechanosensitive channel